MQNQQQNRADGRPDRKPKQNVLVPLENFRFLSELDGLGHRKFRIMDTFLKRMGSNYFFNTRIRTWNCEKSLARTPKARTWLTGLTQIQASSDEDNRLRTVHLSMWTTDPHLGSDHLIDGFGRPRSFVIDGRRWTADEKGSSPSWTDSDDRPFNIWNGDGGGQMDENPSVEVWYQFSPITWKYC